MSLCPTFRYVYCAFLRCAACIHVSSTPTPMATVPRVVSADRLCACAGKNAKFEPTLGCFVAYTVFGVKLTYLGPAYLHAFLTNKVRLQSVIVLALKPNLYYGQKDWILFELPSGARPNPGLGGKKMWIC